MKRIGIIGLGLKNPYTYARILEKMDAKVVAIYDEYPELVDEYATTFCCRAVYDIKFYPFDEVDGVIIDTKNSDHIKAAELAIENGKPVFIDKPLAPSAEEALEFLSKKHVVPWFSASPLRFSPLYKTMKDDLIKTGEKIEFIRVTVYHTMEHFMTKPDKHWHDSLIDGGGMLVDIGIHGIELLNYFVEEDPDEILYMKSNSHYENSKSGDSHHVLFRYADGSVGIFDLICATDHLDYSVEVSTLHHRFLNTNSEPYVKGGLYDADNAYGAFDSVMAAFLKMIETGKSPLDYKETERNFRLFNRIISKENK